MGSSEPVEVTNLGMATIVSNNCQHELEKPEWRLMSECVNQVRHMNTQLIDGHGKKLTMFLFRVYIFPR